MIIYRVNYSEHLRLEGTSCITSGIGGALLFCRVFYMVITKCILFEMTPREWELVSLLM